MTKEEYMAIREDKTDMLEEFVEWRNKNGEDEPFMTVNVDYYESTNSDGERRIRVVTTTQKWVGSSKDPVASTTFEYL
jgi:hypothetical protein